MGYTGSQGDTGVGFTGSTGFTGSIGLTGSIGFIGSTGFTGSTGLTGSRGFTGSIGFTGSTGLTGSQGIGLTGSIGFTGSSGFTGSTGLTGSQGIGLTGSIGFTGSTGLTGSQGVSGTSILGTYNVWTENNQFGSTNFVLLSGADGGVEICRLSGGAYIDFKDLSSDDYDVRISQSGAGITVSGRLNFAADNGLYIDKSSSNPIINLDSNDYLIYDRTNNILDVVINSGTKLSVRGDSEIRSALFRDIDNTGFYVDPPGNSLLNSIYTYGFISVQGNAPEYRWYETDVGTNLKYWRAVTEGSTWYLQTLDDSFGSLANMLSVDRSGNLVVLANVTAYGSPSDQKFKTNVKDIYNALEKVSRLRAVTFDWKEETPQYTQVNLKHDVGFIAQEVQEIMPDLVRDFDGSLSLRERGIVPYLVAAIQELGALVKEQQERLDKLESI